MKGKSYVASLASRRLGVARDACVEELDGFSIQSEQEKLENGDARRQDDQHTGQRVP